MNHSQATFDFFLSGHALDPGGLLLRRLFHELQRPRAVRDVSQGREIRARETGPVGKGM